LAISRVKLIRLMTRQDFTETAFLADVWETLGSLGLKS